MAASPVLKTPAGASRPQVAPHAGRRLFIVYLLVGAAATASGSFLAAFVSDRPYTVAAGVLYAAIGLWFFSIGVYGTAAGAAVQVINSSLNLIGQGKLRDAEALLDTVRSTRVRNVQRAALVQRAMIAIRRGSLADAEAFADVAIAVPLGWLGRLHAALQKTNAHGIRAMVRASTGDEAGARSDIAEVRRDPHALPQSLARAALAELLLLERAGDRAAIARSLQKERRLLLEATDPRERAIVRGLQRLLKTPPSSVYRVQADRPTAPAGAEELALDDWVQAIAPRVAPFMRAQPPQRAADGRGERGASTQPGEEARAAVKADRAHAAREAGRSASPQRRRGLVAVAVALVAVVAYMRFRPTSGLSDDGLDGTGGGADPVAFMSLLLGVLSSIAALRMALTMRLTRTHTHQLARLSTQLLGGEHEAAARELEGLAKSPFAFIAAQAELLRAGLAERRGDFAEVVARCDAALGRLSRYAVRVLASDLLLPELIAARACGLAALGRGDEARVEVAALPPAYPFLARARFRTELYALAHRGDFAAAAEIAAQAPPDLPIGPRDELLRDVVRAAVAPEAAGSAELERLREELRENADERAWLEIAAPGLVAAFERATISDDSEDARAEAEAEAEIDAAAGEQRTRLISRQVPGGGRVS